MSLDEQLDIMEDGYETQAEQIDEETEIQDVADDMDEYLGEEALESDQTHAYDSFFTKNEADYDGYDPSEVTEAYERVEESDMLHSEGYHIEDRHDLEEEVIEMEVEEGDIHAYILDENDEEIGFVLIDEDGNEQEYYYVDMDEYEFVDDEEDAKVVRASDGEEFDLGITREGIEEATADVNAIYKDGVEIAAELKSTFDDIAEGMSFIKKK